MRILITAAHPDDVEPQMGGAVAKYTKEGNEVLILTIIVPNQKEKRIQEAKEAAEILKAELKILDEDPYKLRFNRKLIEKIDEVIKSYNPDVVYTCWVHDSHQDHQAVARATFAATRKNNCNLYMFEPAMPGGIVPEKFKPTTYVDISKYIKQKIKSIKKYKSQIFKYKNWVDASVGRSRYRGFEIGVDYAEAFQVVREIK